MIQFEAKSLLCRTACKQKKRKPLYSSCSVGRAWEFKVSRRDTAVWSLWAWKHFGSLLQCALAVQVAMVLLFETLLRSSLATHHMLQLVLSSGLDVCGLRLLYPQHDVLLSSSGEVEFSSSDSAV